MFRGHKKQEQFWTYKFMQLVEMDRKFRQNNGQFEVEDFPKCSY